MEYELVVFNDVIGVNTIGIWKYSTQRPVAFLTRLINFHQSKFRAYVLSSQNVLSESFDSLQYGLLYCSTSWVSEVYARCKSRRCWLQSVSMTLRLERLKQGRVNRSWRE